MPSAWPPIVDLVQPFLGKPYDEGDCWKLVCELLHAGNFLEVPDDPLKAVEQVAEVWWQDDPRDPLTLVQPWDLWLMRKAGKGVGHVGLVVDTQRFLHVGHKVGVCLEPLKRWQPRLLQIARLRSLW